jgi:hypothetical protein
MIYSRIQELGGVTGRDHRTHLKPRPYVKPAIEKTAPVVQDLARDLWNAALKG